MAASPPLTWLDDFPHGELAEGGAPLHEVVRTGLHQVIQQRFDDGQRFWTEEELSEKLQVSRVTVRRALSDLSVEGALCRFRARGTFVRKTAVDTVVPSLGTNGETPLHRTFPLAVPAPLMALPFRAMGVFVTQFNSQFTADMLDQFAAAAARAGVEFRVYRTHQGDSGNRALEQLDLPPSEMAVILFANTPGLTRELYCELELAGYRVVTVDVVLSDFPSAYVGTNNEMGIRLAMRHLIELGHEDITFLLSEPDETLVVESRLNTFLSVARERELRGAQVANAHLKHWEDPIAAAYALMPGIWHGAKRPTAILCASDAGAGAVLRWCAEQKIAVPGEVSVMGFDDGRTSRYLNPPLTTVSHPWERIARRAVEILAGDGLSHEFLPPSLVVRASTGPVGSGR